MYCYRCVHKNSFNSAYSQKGHLKDWFKSDLCQLTSTHLESDIKLIRIVDGDDPLVSGLILKVEVQLDGEDKNGNLPVQD